MGGVSAFTWLLILWGLVTIVFVVLMIWRGLAGMREDDQIFLDEAEEGMAQEQRQIIAKVERISNYAKGFGFAWVALLLIAAGVWVYRGFVTFTHPTIP